MLLNMKLLAQHALNGFGGMGEGMSMQLARGGRRILWLAHESAPKNFTAVDVTEPRAPKVVVQKIGRAHVLNSSHPSISYAVFCLKKKTKTCAVHCCGPRASRQVRRKERRKSFEDALSATRYPSAA